jgi:PPOX class probable F420-dependent enzyme
MGEKLSAISDVQDSKCLSLTTFKRDGSGVSTPVWFNVIGDKIYVTTDLKAWKIRRAINNPRVQFAVCTQRGRVTGQAHTGTARILAPHELPAVLAAKKRRYFTFRLIHLVTKDQAGIEITPDVQGEAGKTH